MPSVNYSFLRGLELEGGHPHDVGAWHITVRRLEVGEGLPPYMDPTFMVEFAEGAPYPPAPKLPSTSLLRLFCYRRIRSSADAERHIQRVAPEVPVSVDVFASWAKPPADDVIPMPKEEERPLSESHLVVLRGCVPERRAFTFQNTWGDAWGNHGWAALLYDYVDKYAFESWVSYHETQIRLESSKKERVSGRVEIRWVARDEWDRRVYGFEIWNEKESERQGWSFVMETKDAVEIEDLYVRPEFRGMGLGKVLANKVRGMANAKKMPLRAWVPFADCKQENPSNYPAIIAIAKLLGIQFQFCREIWAAYYATDEQPGSVTPVEPVRVPPRPKSALEAVLAAALALASGSGQVTPPASAAAVSHEADGAAEPGTEAWGLMNRRRAELIRKKNREGLSNEERAEYEALQRQVQRTLERKYPAPSTWGERIAQIEEQLRTERGAGSG
jgi:GNAT superfamily N-acetyltransferase